MNIAWDTLFAVGAGGGLGAMLRFAASGAVYRWTGEDFPYGTLLVNVLGSLVLGFIAQLSETRVSPGPLMKMFLTVGLCGGFTTFSTFSLETWRLMADGSYLAATANAAGSVLLCLLGIYAGVLLARLL
jgi:CrcB protein